MVDLSQWRAAIGLWHCRLSSGHQKGSLKSRSRQSDVPDPPDDDCHWMNNETTAGFCSLKLAWLFAAFGCSCFLLLFLLFQLILLLSGDVELNPGPITNEQGK